LQSRLTRWVSPTSADERVPQGKSGGIGKLACDCPIASPIAQSSDPASQRYDSDEEEGEGNAAKRRKADGSDSDTDSDGGAKPDVSADGKAASGDDRDGKALMSLPEWIAFAATKNYSKELYVAKFFRVRCTGRLCSASRPPR
jgi:hypothetical protein